MKAQYTPCYETYESFHSEILSDLEIATEADEPASNPTDVSKTTINNAKTATSDTVKDDNTSQAESTKKRIDVMAKMKKFIEIIKRVIMDSSKTISVRSRLILESTAGFNKTYNAQKRTVKPVQKVEVVSYTYVSGYLDKVVISLFKDFMKVVDALSTVEGATMDDRTRAIVEATSTKAFEILYEPYCKGADEPITTSTAFSKFTTSKFRGPKKEHVYEQSMIPTLETRANNVSGFLDRANKMVRDMNASQRKANNLLTIASNTATKDEVKDKAAKNISRIADLYSSMTFLIKMYTEWSLEECLNYRAILKRFYNI